MSGFVDEAQIHAKGGDGGAGAVSFRREAHVDRGGPDGGDGGRGGDVWLVSTTNQASLLGFRDHPHRRATDGGHGSGQRRHGSRGTDLLVPVPVGTVVRERDGSVLCDLSGPGDRWLAAEGGRGGQGNARFLSNRRRAPAFAEQGEHGQERWLDVELKLVADVALVGFPNVGKSTLISSVSAAKPKVADYPFTTLQPHLGVVRVGDVELVMADVPGLVEGAAEGRGLGHRFLRHIERARALLLLLDLAPADGISPEEQLRVLSAELAQYQPELLARPRLVVGSKADLLVGDAGGQAATAPGWHGGPAQADLLVGEAGGQTDTAPGGDAHTAPGWHGGPAQADLLVGEAGGQTDTAPGGDAHTAPGWHGGPAQADLLVGEAGGQTHTAPGGDAHTAPGGDAHTAPGGDAHTAPAGDAHTAPGGEADRVPGGDAHTAPGGEADRVPGDHAHTAPDGEADRVPGGAAGGGTVDLVVSAATGQGIPDLLYRLARMVTDARAAEDAAAASAGLGEVVVHRPAPEGVRVDRLAPGVWAVAGRAARRAVSFSDLTDDGALDEAVRRLRRLGVDRSLARAGARDGDEVHVGEVSFTWYRDQADGVLDRADDPGRRAPGGRAAGGRGRRGRGRGPRPPEEPAIVGQQGGRPGGQVADGRGRGRGPRPPEEPAIVGQQGGRPGGQVADGRGRGRGPRPPEEPAIVGQQGGAPGGPGSTAGVGQGPHAPEEPAIVGQQGGAPGGQVAQ